MIEVNAARVRNARCSLAVHTCFVHVRTNSLFQAVAHGGHFLRGAAVESLLRYLGCLAQTHNSGDVFCPCAARTLVAAAVEQRLDASSLLHIKRADALRCMNLVAGDGERVTANLPY